MDGGPWLLPGRMSPVLIRPRRDSDAGVLEAIAYRTHELDGYPKYLPGDLKSFIVDTAALGAWVAVCAREVVGHVALHRSSVPEVMEMALSATGLGPEGIAVVARMLVDPPARRQGIGRALLGLAEVEAARLGRKAVLDVVDVHQAAIALYDACGWTRVGEVRWELPGGRPFREFVYVAPSGTSADVRSGR